jgi:hypothetical protein
MNEFETINIEILRLLEEWETKLMGLSHDMITARRNDQGRNIKQILGHLADSASNNTHRTIHLQYQKSPLQFPNYASYGNNDRWIAIQNYQEEKWSDLIQYWKYLNMHLVHVFRNVDVSKLDNLWQSDDNKFISLRESIPYYLQHFRLHLDEIQKLIDSK